MANRLFGPAIFKYLIRWFLIRCLGHELENHEREIMIGKSWRANIWLVCCRWLEATGATTLLGALLKLHFMPE